MKSNFLVDKASKLESVDSWHSEVYDHTPLNTGHWRKAPEYRLGENITREQSETHGDVRLANDSPSTQFNYSTDSSGLNPRHRHMPDQFNSPQEKSQIFYPEEPVTTLAENSSVDTSNYEDARDPHYLPPEADLPPPRKYLQLKDAIDFIASFKGDQLPAAHWHKIGSIGICALVILRPNRHSCCTACQGKCLTTQRRATIFPIFPPSIIYLYFFAFTMIQL